MTDILLCPHFGECGGCLSLDQEYRIQIEKKEEYLLSLFNKEIKIVPASPIHFYRNKIDFIFTKGKIGLRKKGVHNYVCEIIQCNLISNKCNEILNFVRKKIYEYQIPDYDIESNKGFLRRIVIREGKFTNELMINFICKNKEEAKLEKVVFELMNNFKIYSINWLINKTKSNKPKGDLYQSWMNNYITEILDNVVYKIYPNAFFQSNPFQTINVLKRIKSFIPQGSILLDLYCGVGTIGIFVHEKCKEVIGIDNVSENIKCANENKELNNALNCNFYLDDANSKLLYEKKFDIVIVDPPRTGLRKRLSKVLLKRKIPQIIYMSCNPETQNEDFKILLKNYKLTFLEGYDFFPHTPHIETVGILELR